MDAPPPDLAPLGVPTAAHALIDRLAAAGHEAVLVGRCVRQLLGGVALREMEIVTSAPISALLALFPQAVVTGVAEDRASIPTASGPADVHPLRAGEDFEAALARRDFTIHAMAYDPRTGTLLDPFDGRSDLAKGLLRPVTATSRDPLAAVRAAALVATLGVEAAPELIPALARAARRLDGVPRVRIRDELQPLLLGPRAAEGLALLRRTGAEGAIAPGVTDDAAGVVARLPMELLLRLAGWLRNTRAIRTLRRLRYPRPWVDHVEAVLRLHPVEAQTRTSQQQRRMARRPQRLRSDLLALRAAEIAARDEGPAAQRALDDARLALERVLSADLQARGRTELALGGRAIMEHLGCGPGPEVGLALRHLTAAVSEDPSRNQPDKLLELLDAWSATR